ncbi:TetR/AcrR family transcriptional regulator [Actinomadura sp. NAK00032]|uniref:TetR/AcrR family transcriptional regulator n=1 Tax=Actinomadura sp. NAK00032 TaxID=2742128 RepID=UPI00158FF18E|nr:TetR/AcrR family transcriptional regulator [Actinomadura sp. NAK00032]QKW36886.1 TetR/AcrR family transcriptional regulator [Actinomadura sp. NAK00032]
MSKREEQRVATRARIVEAAVESLVEAGVAATTTVEVQRRAGVSRGALLHHFATHEELFGAAVGRLVQRNEDAVREELDAVPASGDALLRGVRVLRAVLRRPSFGAELELWAVARTNPRLWRVLRRAEGAARRDLFRVVGEILGPEVTGMPGYPLVAELTVQLLRGMAISDVLYREDADRDALLERWVEVVRPLLAGPGSQKEER